MQTDAPQKPSFSAAHKWAIGFHVILAVLAVLALVAMANYLGTRYHLRFQWSAKNKAELSPQTARILKSLTNEVNAVLFFDRESSEELYSLASSLLRQYSYVAPNLTVKSVDFIRNPGAAEAILKEYKLTTLKERNFVVFESEGRTRVVPESELADFQLDPVADSEEREFVRRMVNFKGEMRFTPAILSVVNPRPVKAYFLQGHREHDPAVTEHPHGYAQFASILKDELNVQWDRLGLQGTNDVPADCQLLIIAGPQMPFLENELEKIDRYLNQGGRLLALLNSPARADKTGIEKILARWNVALGNAAVFDPANSPSPAGADLLAARLSDQHEVVKPLVQEGLTVRLVLPRAVGLASADVRGAEAPKVSVLAATGDNAFEATWRDGKPFRNPFVDRQGMLPLMVAVERGTIKGVADRGTRMIVVGDSFGFDNELIDTAANHYFTGLAVNWLIDRPQVLIEGLVPKPVKRYRVIMTEAQRNKVRWLLLGALPGGVLVFGSLVWLRRRS